MSILLRGAGRRDLPAIQELWRARREEERKLVPGLELSPDAESQAAQHRELVLADPRTRFVVAEEREVVLGFAHVQVETNELAFEPERYGVLVDLVVRSDSRGQGLARRLLEQVDEWLRGRGVSELRARVLEPDLDARRFLEHTGGTRLTATYRRSVPE